MTALDERIGLTTAYGYAKSKGYTGTEEEFAQAMANAGITLESISEAVDAFINTTVPSAVQSVTTEGNTQVTRVTDTGTAQVNAVNTAGGTNVTAVNTAGDTNVSAVNSAGATQVGNVNTAGTTQVGNVNTAGTTQVNAVQAKGQEVINSIPSDYTDLSNTVSDLLSAINDTDDFLLGFLGTISRTNVTVSKGSTRKELLRFDLTSGNGITIDIKLHSALSVSTYLYLQTENGTDLFPSTSRSIPAGSTTFKYLYTPSADNKNCKLQYTIASSATTDALFDYVKITTNDSTYAADLAGIKETISDITGDVIVPFEIGSILINSSGWTYGENTKRIRTPQGKTVHLYVGDILTIESGAEFYIGALKQDGTYYNGSTWKTGTFTIAVEGDYVFVGRYNPEVVVDDVSALAAKLTVFTNASMQGDVNMLKSGYGTGNVEYTGGRITLTNNPIEKHRCSIELWKNFTDVSQYNLYLNQSMAIYNGYVFVFNQNGAGCVLDYSTKDIISTFTLPVTANQHSNSAQFMDIYYNENDDYPLLLISRCGNADYSSGTHDLDEAQVYRVQESNGVFTFTLINTIRFSKQTYGISWGVDNVNKKLYATATVNGNWSVRENNPKYYWVFELPNATSIMSGTEIVLAESDALETMKIDFAIGQGLFVDGGVVYEGVQDFSSGSAVAKVWAVDVGKNRIVSKVPLTISWEPEGVALYGGKIYVTQKNGSDTTGTNPMKIYELTF